MILLVCPLSAERFLIKIKRKKVISNTLNHFLITTFQRPQSINIWFRDQIAPKPIYMDVFVSSPFKTKISQSI